MSAFPFYRCENDHIPTHRTNLRISWISVIVLCKLYIALYKNVKHNYCYYSHLWFSHDIYVRNHIRKIFHSFRKTQLNRYGSLIYEAKLPYFILLKATWKYISTVYYLSIQDKIVLDMFQGACPLITPPKGNYPAL